jgi:mutator protein MutT
VTLERRVTRVVAAVIERDGKLLITRRREGGPLGGLWEFPGGKPDPGESDADALRRELREELDAAIRVGEPLETVEWSYPDMRVELHFFRCTLEGSVRALEGQQMAWVAPGDLPGYEFPPADAALVARLSRG